MQRSWWTLAVIVAGCAAQGDGELDSDDPFPFEDESGGGGGGVDVPSFDAEADDEGNLDTAECPASADESLTAGEVVDGAVTLTHTGLDLAQCDAWTAVATIDTTNLQIAITHTTDDISVCGDVCDYGFTYELSDLAPGLWTVYAGSQVLALDVD